MSATRCAPVLLVLAMIACNDSNPVARQPLNAAARDVTTAQDYFEPNPDPSFWATESTSSASALRAPTPGSLLFALPPAPVGNAAVFSSGGLTPASLSAVLLPGQTVTEHKSIDLPAAPPKGDVLFSMDLTGSMGGELANVKANSIAIMNAVAGVIGDAQFGLISYEDYNGTFATTPALGCNYVQTYGTGTDRPYRLDRAITPSTSAVQTSINAMVLKNGFDGPESYARALFETYSDANIAWRTGARRIVVNFGDDVPHDCKYDAIIGGSGASGRDPGRDNVVGTSDDLFILDVLHGMATNNTTLISLHSGTHNSLWSAYAGLTPGGVNFAINADGTFPGGVNPAVKIAQLIQSVVGTVNSLALQPCPGSEGFASWLQSVSPASYTNVTLPATKPFDAVVGPPAGTPGGTYTFSLCAVGDGAEFGRQTVTITVPNAPTASAGPDQTLECSHGGASVTLAGSASDADNDISTIEWLENGSVVATGLTPTVNLAAGVHTLTLRVTDATHLVATSTVTITVQDTTAPTATLTVTPNELWPPNHKYEKIVVKLVAADGCSAASD